MGAPFTGKALSVLAQSMHPIPRNPLVVVNHAASIMVSDPSHHSDVLSYMVCVMVRADHKESGGKYSIDETEDAEDGIMIRSDLMFPACIAYGSTGSPKYVTDKVEVTSGAEQRNQRRAYPRHEYNINMENIPANEIAEIMNLWHVCSGDFIGFLFLDPMDHTSRNVVDVNMTGSTVDKLDQFVAVASGVIDSYPLFKYYIAGEHAVPRRILYPDLDTLVVSVNGYEITSFDFSYTTNLLRFTTPVPAGAPITAPLSRSSGGAITGADFSALSPGDLIYMTGFANNAYDAPVGSDPARVLFADATTLVVQKFNGTAYGAIATTAAAGVIRSAIPPTGSEIRAGFYFYVPVRFEDGDVMEGEIKQGLRESAVASFTRIKLREVFE